MANSGVKVGNIPYNKGMSMLEEQKIKLSCVNRNIEVKDFDNFTMSVSQKERNKFDDSGLRDECFKNADYTCDYCNKKGGRLNAHHMDSWKSFPKNRFELDNLVTLCRKCHMLIHNIYGVSTTKKQYEELKNRSDLSRTLK